MTTSPLVQSREEPQTGSKYLRPRSIKYLVDGLRTSVLTFRSDRCQRDPVFRSALMALELFTVLRAA